MKALVKISSERSVKLKKATKIISFGGEKTCKKMIEVYSTFDDPPNVYPDFTSDVGMVLADDDNKLHAIGSCVNRRIDIVNNTRIKWIDVCTNNYKYRRSAAIFQNNPAMICFDTRNKFKFYFPQLEDWIDGPQLNQARTESALVSHRNKLYALGGHTNSHVSSSAEILNYSIVSLQNYRCYNRCLSDDELKQYTHSRWCETCRKCCLGRHYFPRNALPGNVEEHKEPVIPSVKISGNWVKIQPMQKARCNFVAISCGSYIYAIGGQSNNIDATKTVERYHPKSDDWTYVEEMEFERSDHAACVLDGKIYVVGGLDADEKAVKAIECYNPGANSWSVVGETTNELYGHSVIAF